MSRLARSTPSPRTERSARAAAGLLPALLRRHERRLRVALPLACLALVAGTGLIVELRGVERLANLARRLWLARIERAEELVLEGRYELAEPRLERLDRSFPATWVKHRDGYLRQRVLELLAATHGALGHERLALDAYERLVAFDPRRWRSRFLLAEACRRFHREERAEEAYAGVLALHPSHLQSVEALVAMRFEAGHRTAVPALLEAYLDAWLLAPGTLRLGDAAWPLEFPVDGRERWIEVPVDVAAGWGGRLCIETAGYSVRIASVELLEPATVGAARPAGRRELAGTRGWEGLGMRAEGDAWVAEEPGSRLCLALPGLDATPLARVRVRLAGYKALSAKLLDMAQQSYHDLGEREAWEALRRRSLVGGWPHGDPRFWPPRKRVKGSPP